MAQQTRHGNYGGPRGLYGDFTGKAEAVATILNAILAQPVFYRPHASAAAYRPHATEVVYRPHSSGGRVS